MSVLRVLPALSVLFVVGLGAAASCAAPASEGSGPAAAPGPRGEASSGRSTEAEPTADPRGRTVQPGAPGEPTRIVDPDAAAATAGAGYVEADVRFMQGMIPHHAQALEMTALIPGRTDSEAIRRMGLRMEISQRDEIALMERWLRERGEAVPGEGHGVHGEGELMPGMLTPEEMDRLAAARGTAFDRLFLDLMIMHHEGALVMVAELLAAPGAAQASEVFRFASHVDADQTMEIDRMRRLLQALPTDTPPDTDSR